MVVQSDRTASPRGKGPDGSRPRNPIDAFLSDNRPRRPGRSPHAVAPAHFDLTGLPPTPEEVDRVPATIARTPTRTAVDRLLASPRYGEHRARMWLDVVRYSDSNGFDWDEFRPQAWRFRDYVVRSFNADKPFDQFIREQLAGDELLDGPPRTPAEQDCSDRHRLPAARPARQRARACSTSRTAAAPS